MDKICYSDKEVAILNGMIELIKNGANPYLVKVSDIAKSAGVGKGTIYEYFQTKEEVILKALMFSISNEINTIIQKVDVKSSFKDKYYEILYAIVENLENKYSTFNILVTSEKLPDFQMKKTKHICEFNEHLLEIDKLINDMLVCGYKEGEIKEIESKYYSGMVFRSSILSFGNFMTMQKNRYKDITIKEAMDAAYKMVIKSLN